MCFFGISGIVFLSYAILQFRKHYIFLPSIMFSIMWGFNCIYTECILLGWIKNLNLADHYYYSHMERYIVFMTIISVLGFSLAHKCGQKRINVKISLSSVFAILRRYRFIMWLNFFGGLLRIILILATFGFGSIMDYRLNANATMMTATGGGLGLLIKLTAYIQLLANFYIAIYGFYTGFNRIKLKQVLFMFLLYAPTQMATGGRLFIFYFILFFFGAFLLGRGLSFRGKKGKLFTESEVKVLVFVLSALFLLIAFIGMARSFSNGVYKGSESIIGKFSYITEGMLATEYAMDYFEDSNFRLGLGENTFGSVATEEYLDFRWYLRDTTRMGSVVICHILPLYLDFGFVGSLIIWGVLAFIIELIALKCLSNFKLIPLFIYTLMLKICFESVMTNPFSTNIPVFELILLLAIFYKQIFSLKTKI